MKFLPSRKTVLRIAVATICALVVFVVVAWIVTSTTATERVVSPVVSHDASMVAPAMPADDDTIAVMTVNLAHGRGVGWHQLLQTGGRARSNLDAVATVLEREAPWVVALQEADGPSFWSGSFDHVDHVASAARYPWSVHGEHVRGAGLSYGTGALSRTRVSGARTHTFEPTPPTFAKGFLRVTFLWPATAREVDLVSVHLDFSRAGVRAAQIDAMIEQLSERQRPLIVAGDLNSEWDDDPSPVRRLAETLDLQAFRPDADDLATFPTLGTRLDWILVSAEIEIVSSRVLDDPVSDHRPVIARLRLRSR